MRDGCIGLGCGSAEAQLCCAVLVCRYQQLYDATLKTRLREAVMGGMLLGYTQVRQPPGQSHNCRVERRETYTTRHRCQYSNLADLVGPC